MKAALSLTLSEAEAAPTSVKPRRRRRGITAVGAGDAKPTEKLDLRRTLLEANGSQWPRLTDECSSALELMGGPAVVGVTSCIRGEGRSTIAIAMALAQPYRYGTTVLLEADVEKPSLAATLELQQAPGVADVLEGASSLEETIQWTGESVGVVTAGSAGTDTSALLSRLLRRNLVGELRELADSVIVDLPPFVGPGVGMARACPRVVVVVRAGSTPLDRLERVAAELDHPPVIVNRADERLPPWLRRMFRTTS